MNGDELTLCAKLFNNTLPKKDWSFPVNCKEGDYIFKFKTQNDENYQ